ncbi:MAG: type I glyceraldehyde-3-phosphate dehydrogenase [Gammaproteobacteria bacterium]|nr:type I glyceraldehyde-3-phosphate dehydrogenase [Gammaproteobacteria bacterium]MBL6819277.1 type I glyceraldehyde-3-phosphate dehydrogenase [Gammaproteobacteria bacterium]MBL6898456.1 type I glyceraldehyde-3-phosphate dehydrogenase [Gammaproteobacteria bacterium]
MTIRVAINGFGRIGRNILRAKYESDKYQDIQIVAINDLGDSNINAHLLIHDTVHGKFNKPVEVREDKIIIDNSDEILVTSERDPNNLPWEKLKVDVVYECTGIFVSKDKAGGHIKAGAKKVIISAPGKEIDNTVVYGVNHDTLTDQHQVISNASCTTNCLATVIKNIHKNLDITNGLMTTIHAYTNDQVLTDVYHTDLRRARSATQSMIPTKTGAAAAVGLVMPDLNGKLDGFAVRVPTTNVSVVDLCFNTSKSTSVDGLNNLVMESSNTDMKGIVGYNNLPLVSVDFNHSSYSSVFDESLTKVSEGKLYKICAWYDNEWGFSNRMLDVTIHWVK